MANFFSGLVKGTVLAGVALVTASVLLPQRPKIPPPDVTQSPVKADPPAQPEAASPSPAQPAAATPQPEAAPPVATTVAEPPATQPVATEPPAPEPVIAQPVATQTPPAITAPEPAATPDPAPVAKEALLDPSDKPLVAEPDGLGAKMVTAPPAGTLAKLGDDTIAATSQSISTTPQAAVETEQPATSTALVNAPPLQRYAAKFDDPGTKPLFAVILRDTGAKDLDRAALAALPFPVTFAIDPESENANEAMAMYRAAGKEVVMLTAGLPNGATAQDLEQSFQTYEAVLPETVAVMGPAKGGFQDNAILSKLIVPVIAAQGRGLITFDRGLNSAAQNATREGLANAAVFRQIDGTGEAVTVIRRYLDRAVFKAAQDGRAMVMGETLPDTITALTEWTIEGKASQVTLAPVSAILR